MSPPLWRLYLRGAISNSLGGAILVGVGRSLGLSHHTLLAFSVQLAVFLVHGLPFRSEKFYDLSGSATHLAAHARRDDLPGWHALGSTAAPAPGPSTRLAAS